MRWMIMGTVLAMALVLGCSRQKEPESTEKTAPAVTERGEETVAARQEPTTAPANVTPQTSAPKPVEGPAPATANSVEKEDLPTQEDFETSVDEKITEENLEKELEDLESDLAE